MTTASNLETAEQKRKATVAELAAKQTPKSAAAAAKAADDAHALAVLR